MFRLIGTRIMTKHSATLSFYGAAGTVTGSKYLVQCGRSSVLVDCGLFQGEKQLREQNWAAPPFDPATLDAVVITHAHIDHTGYLPRLMREGFRGPIYCSHATAILMGILLPDAGRLQEDDAHFRNKHALTKHAPALPLYTEDDAREVLRQVRSVKGEAPQVEVAAGITASLFNAGHIIGSRFVVLDVKLGKHGPSRRVLFSGDLGRHDHLILREPAPPPECDDLIVECTYGDRLHDRSRVDEDLARVICDAAHKRSPILIPAFSVGRTQEVLYRIHELEKANKIPVMPVWVDSPMASHVSQAYERLAGEFDEPYRRELASRLSPLKTSSMQAASSREESKHLNEAKGARIVISAAGMMTGGRVLHHALRILPDPNAILLLAGFQARGTTGRRLLDGEKEVKIMGQWTQVRCRIEHLEGLSSHPDWKETLEWLSGIPAPPSRVFLTHGEPEATEAMERHIADRFGWNTHIPVQGETVDLDCPDNASG